MKKLYENSSDGWSEAIQTAVQDACDDINRLQYEINSCVRGSFTNCDSAEELADYIRSLADNLLSAADDVEGCPTSDDDDDEFYESAKTNHSIKECRKLASRKQFAAAYGKKLHESKAKPKARKPYKMREEENPYEWDVKTEKKALRKQFPEMSDNEMTIKAAAKIAKKNNVTRKTVLATLKPANNIKGEKTWDKEGNVFTK